MTSGAALKQGFRLARRSRAAVWILFLTNLGLAALAALPIYRGILRFTGYSLMSQELVRGLAADWLTDFAINNPGALERYAAVITLVALLAIPVNAVLAGGVLCRLRDPEAGFSLGGFFRDTARYAWRLIRLMILGLICYWIVLRLLNQGLSSHIGEWTHDWQSDRAVFWLQLGVSILVLLGLGFVNLILDYARLKLVMEDGSSAACAFFSSLGFCLARFRRAVTVYILPTLCGLALLGLYRLVVPWSVINAPVSEGTWAQFRGPLLVALLFLGQQVVIFGRFWFRVATWASEWSYYAGTRPGAAPPAPVPAETPSPV
jgi:hypothetical protein